MSFFIDVAVLFSSIIPAHFAVFAVLSCSFPHKKRTNPSLRSLYFQTSCGCFEISKIIRLL